MICGTEGEYIKHAAELAVVGLMATAQVLVVVKHKTCFISYISYNMNLNDSRIMLFVSRFTMFRSLGMYFHGSQSKKNQQQMLIHSLWSRLHVLKKKTRVLSGLVSECHVLFNDIDESLTDFIIAFLTETVSVEVLSVSTNSNLRVFSNISNFVLSNLRSSSVLVNNVINQYSVTVLQSIAQEQEMVQSKLLDEIFKAFGVIEKDYTQLAFDDYIAGLKEILDGFDETEF